MLSIGSGVRWPPANAEKLLKEYLLPLFWKAAQSTMLFLFSKEACLHVTLQIISLTFLKMKMELMLSKYTMDTCFM